MEFTDCLYTDHLTRIFIPLQDVEVKSALTSVWRQILQGPGIRKIEGISKQGAEQRVFETWRFKGQWGRQNIAQTDGLEADTEAGVCSKVSGKRNFKEQEGQKEI